jgi:hypothetical protein
MKALPACIALGLMLSSPAAHADYFQLFDASGRNYLELARVQIEGRVLFTDRYGRLQLTLPRGEHSARVTVGGAQQTVVFRVDGDDRLKTLRVP